VTDQRLKVFQAFGFYYRASPLWQHWLRDSPSSSVGYPPTVQRGCQQFAPGRYGAGINAEFRNLN